MFYHLYMCPIVIYACSFDFFCYGLELFSSPCLRLHVQPGHIDEGPRLFQFFHPVRLHFCVVSINKYTQNANVSLCKFVFDFMPLHEFLLRTLYWLNDC